MERCNKSVPERLSEVRVVFDFSASDNWIAPSIPILLPVLSENSKLIKQIYCHRDRAKREMN
jgi:hypothetical protein